MIKIRIDHGWWPAGDKMETLYHEDCYKCSTAAFYPDHTNGVTCPRCKVKLLGIDFMEGYGKRMAYHLEV